MKNIIDIHTKNAAKVVEYEYFVVARPSDNESAGLLVGTGLRKLKEPVGRPSRYGDYNYYNVLMECPNGETRKIGCDAIMPSSPAVFWAQRKVFPRIS